MDFPGVSGFSMRNLKYMRKFAEAYPDSQFVQALLAQLPTMPTGMSEYEVNIMDALRKEFRGTLPTAAEIEAKLTQHRAEDVLDRNGL